MTETVRCPALGSTGLLGTEFPSFDTRRTGEKTDYTVLMQNTHAKTDAAWGNDTVLDLSNDKIQRYSYSNNWLAEEHLLVPAPDSSAVANGWVLGTAIKISTRKATLNIFEANALRNGPVAQLALPYGLPLGLHGQFVPGQWQTNHHCIPSLCPRVMATFPLLRPVST